VRKKGVGGGSGEVAGGGKVDLSLMAKPGQGAAGRWRIGVFFTGGAGGSFGWDEEANV